MESKIVIMAHNIIKEFKNKNIAIDATSGNGYDTVFLGNLFNTVYSFDIQPLAVKRTKEKAIGLSNVHIYLEDFNNINNYVKEADCIIFNLGFLPGSNKRIKTNQFNSDIAIKKCYNILNPNGIMIICCYVEHDGGAEEFKSIINTLNINNIQFEMFDEFDNNEKLLYIKKGE